METKLIRDNDKLQSIIINLNQKNSLTNTSQISNTYFQYHPNIKLDYDEDDIKQKYLGEAVVFNNSFITEKDISGIDNFLNSLDCNTLYEGIKKAINFFALRNNYSHQIIQGFYGEFLFILKMYEKRINITKNFHIKLFNKHDFYFQGKTLEIKTTTLNSSIYTISNSQIETTNNLIGLIGIKVEEVSNGENFSNSQKLNLLDLIEKIKRTMTIESRTLIDLFEQIISDASYESLIKDIYFHFNYSDEIFNIYRKETLPTIESNFKERIFNLKYQINMLGIQTITFDELIKELE